MHEEKGFFRSNGRYLIMGVVAVVLLKAHISKKTSSTQTSPSSFYEPSLSLTSSTTSSSYERYAESCVHGENIEKHSNKSVLECAAICDNIPNCMGFEYGVDYGGEGNYVPGDCQPQSSNDITGCDGKYYNLDFYEKVPSPTIICATAAATLYGATYASCEGTYAESTDTIQGRSIWDRASPDASRFIFWCMDRWRITGSQWRAELIEEDGGACGAFISSDDAATEWHAAEWESSNAAAGDKTLLFLPRSVVEELIVATLNGSTYASCEGTYAKSTDKIQGRPIWDRIAPDASRFIFYCGNRWRITGSQWRAELIEEDGGGCGSFISSDDTAMTWYMASWTEAGAVASDAELFYPPVSPACSVSTEPTLSTRLAET